MNAGGQNKAIPQAGKAAVPIPINDFPWLLRPDAEKWDDRGIYNFLRDHLYEHGVTTTQLQAAALAKLADAHWMLKIAKDAVRKDPEEPKVGKKCAYGLIKTSHDSIASAMKQMGISFEKHTPKQEDADEIDVDSFDSMSDE